jgi:hypothetical protein
MNFSSSIDNAKKSLAKVMNHRIEKLSTFLNANETQLNDVSQISIERENTTNETNDER